MPPRRRVASGLAALLLLGACAKAGDSGLQVKGYPADVVFGATTKPAPVVATPPPDLTAQQAASDVPLPLPAEPEPAPPAPKYVGPPLAPRRVCPDAPAGSAAAEAAPTNVPTGRRPEAGTYRWKKAGTVTLATAPNAPLQFGGFEQRRLRNVQDVSDGVFTFQTVQPTFDGRLQRVTTWQVKTNAVAERVAGASLAITAGDPERGLAIKSIDTVNPDGSPADGAGATHFHPSTGLLVLPLPVTAGEQFSSVAVDPTSQQTEVFQASVVGRDHTDACGQFVEGWQVTGTLSETGASDASGTSSDYTVWVAPQLGAMPILEKVKGTASGGLASYDLTLSLGQLHPDPEVAG